MEVLIKTFKAEDFKYAVNLLHKGDLFFQHVMNYQKIEDNQVRGDKNEGKVVERKKMTIEPNIKTVTIGQTIGNQFVLDLEKARNDIPELRGKSLGDIVISYEVDWLLYCLTYLNTNAIDIKDTLKDISQLGKYCVVITDCIDFMQKLLNKTEVCGKGLVKYIETENPDPFIKKPCYAWQHEYRIGISANGEMTKLISVGRLKGFICEVNDLAKRFEVE